MLLFSLKRNQNKNWTDTWLPWLSHLLITILYKCCLMQSACRKWKLCTKLKVFIASESMYRHFFLKSLSLQVNKSKVCLCLHQIYWCQSYGIEKWINISPDICNILDRWNDNRLNNIEINWVKLTWNILKNS